MENEFKEEIEALETLGEYNIKVVKALKEVIPELKGEPKEDTDEYLQHILKGINWEIQVLNGTMDYINKECELVSKEDANKIVEKLNEALKAKDNCQTGEVLEAELLPFLENLEKIVSKDIA